MPQTGYCTDLTCDKELTQLYECHCCGSFVCLNHLLKHVEISKQKSEQLDKLLNELRSASSTLQTIVEKKLHEIEREKQLINQASTMLDMPVYSIDEVQSVFEEINLAVLSNGKEETIVKVEPSLSGVKICTCNNTLQQDESPAVNDATNCIGNSQIVYPVKDEADDEEQNPIESRKPRVLIERCSFTFDEPFNRTTVPDPILLHSTSQTYKPRLIHSLKNKRERKQFHTRRLLQATSNDQHSQTTQLFDKSEDMIFRYHKVLCPLSAGLIDLFDYCKKSSTNKPCRRKLQMGHSLVKHLNNYHGIHLKQAKIIYDAYKEYCTEIVIPLNNNPHSYRSVV